MLIILNNLELIVSLQRDSSSRLQVCRSTNQEAYVLKGASQIYDD
jgi:hypothetical protein